VLEEMAAKITELQSSAQLNQAKAVASTQMVEVAMSGIEADVQQNRETNALRESLAQLSAASKMDTKTIDAKIRVGLQQAKSHAEVAKTVYTTQAQQANQAGMTAPPAAAPLPAES